jgi:IstB-like ATP binding protein
MATTRTKTTPALADPVSADLKQVLRTLKLGRMLDTLPERLTLARQRNLPHADFLELVLADEVTRRDTSSAAVRARAAGLDPGMRLETWDSNAAVQLDEALWTELTTLRFLDGPHGALIHTIPDGGLDVGMLVSGDHS